MASTQTEPAELREEDLAACARESGITVPPGQTAGVLKGARHLKAAALRLRAFLAEQRG